MEKGPGFSCIDAGESWGETRQWTASAGLTRPPFESAHTKNRGLRASWRDFSHDKGLALAAPLASVQEVDTMEYLSTLFQSLPTILLVQGCRSVRTTQTPPIPCNPSRLFCFWLGGFSSRCVSDQENRSPETSVRLASRLLPVSAIESHIRENWGLTRLCGALVVTKRVRTLPELIMECT